jgi:hypothetical protein
MSVYQVFRSGLIKATILEVCNIIQLLTSEPLIMM